MLCNCLASSYFRFPICFDFRFANRFLICDFHPESSIQKFENPIRNRKSNKSDFGNVKACFRCSVRMQGIEQIGFYFFRWSYRLFALGNKNTQFLTNLPFTLRADASRIFIKYLGTSPRLSASGRFNNLFLRWHIYSFSCQY